MNAAEIFREQINLGRLAQQKGSTSHVTELGRMMEYDHTKSMAQLTAMAKAKNISIPAAQTQKGQEVYKKLNEKPEKDFGKKYSNLMVDDHIEAIAMFKKALLGSKDPDIKAWILVTLPTLRIHLKHSVTCEVLCEKIESKLNKKTK